MKNVITIALLLLIQSCGTENQKEKKENTETDVKSEEKTTIEDNEPVASYELDGVWKPLKQEMNGKSFPTEILAKQKVTITGNTFITEAESVDKGEINYANGKMDIYGKEGVNQGKHFMCIYKLENNLLTVCYNLNGDKYPDSYETKDKPGYLLAVFSK